MDLSEISISPQLMAMSDADAGLMALNDIVPTTSHDSETSLLAKSPKQCFFLGNEKALQPRSASRSRQGVNGTSRAQRITPAIMNAMAISYQSHFEAFCKGM